MNTQVFDNSFRVGICPLCGCHEITLSGQLHYDNPTFFSSHSIMLKKMPELWLCKHCGSGFTENAISPQDALVLYEKGDSASRWKYRELETEKTKPLLGFISSLVNPRSVVLDFGCNDGILLDFLKKNGVAHTYGVEASASARNFVKAKGHVVTQTLNELDKLLRFDVIFAMDVIEHLYDIPEFFRNISTRLVSGGLLILLTGNINSIMALMAKNNWWYTRHPEHVRFPSLRWLCNHPEFHVMKFTRVYASKGFVYPFGINAILSASYRWILGKYNGLPVLSPDHYIVALKNASMSTLP